MGLGTEGKRRRGKSVECDNVALGFFFFRVGLDELWVGKKEGRAAENHEGMTGGCKEGKGKKEREEGSTGGRKEGRKEEWKREEKRATRKRDKTSTR